MTLTIAKPTVQVVFDEPTEWVDRSLPTASWWDKYVIQPGAYPLEWVNINHSLWNADPEAITPGYIANIGPYYAACTMRARLIESYRENRLLQHVTAQYLEHDAERELVASVYAYQVPGCPKGQHGRPLDTLRGGRVVPL